MERLSHQKDFKLLVCMQGYAIRKRFRGNRLRRAGIVCGRLYANVFQAAPLQVTKQSIAVEQKLQAVIVNSAYANACTGEQGLKDAYEMRKLCAEAFGLPEHLVAVASTGVIGECLPMENIRASIPKLKPTAQLDGAVDFQTAILTTDLVMKKRVMKRL